MQMGSGGNTGAAHIADQLTLGHILSLADHIVGHVHIDGREAVHSVDRTFIRVALFSINGNKLTNFLWSHTLLGGSFSVIFRTFAK